MKPHRFYICQQPHQEPGELFILHARKPLALFRVRRSEIGADLELVICWDETEPEKLAAVMKKSKQWYWHSLVEKKN